jgi:hypothetical protein
MKFLCLRGSLFPSDGGTNCCIFGFENVRYMKRFNNIRPIFILFLVLVAFSASAQKKYSISGTVKSAETGEALIGATVLFKELKSVGATTNAYGFYSLTVPEGTYTVLARYLGYQTKEVKVNLNKNQNLAFNLDPESIKADEVLVTAERSNKNVESTDMGVRDLEMKDVKSLPVLFGERDIMKTLQLLPGVQASGEGSAGYYARGGGADQNLIMLDEAPVYNSSHVMGYVSVFNADAIKDVKLMTGDIPAEYGGRLSSVLDIRTNDGNNQQFGGAAGIGVIASRVMLEGPIVKDEASFLVTGRRTYADMFLKLSTDTLVNRTSLYFYDLNVKGNYRLGERDRVYLSGYFGRDNFEYPDVFGINWGNATATLRWNHIYGDQLFSNFSLIYSDYSFENTVGASPNRFVISSGIEDVNLKADFQLFISSQNAFHFGVNAIHHTFLPGAITSAPSYFTAAIGLKHKYALENAAYVAHEFDLLPALKLSYGVRLSLFSLLGPGTFYTYDEYGETTDSASYSSWNAVKTFASVEPRVAATYILNEGSSVKAAYTRNAQYLHLLSSTTVSNPSDLWIPSSNNVKPQYADQFSAGYFRNFQQNEFETSVEFYYKNMTNLIDYKNGADLLLNPAVEAMLTYGRGWSYGAEFLLRKRAGVLSGWISYSLSKTMQQLPGVNNGAAFPARQDRTHNVSIVGMYNLNDRWNLAAVWVYSTGNAVTFPSGNYWVDGRLVPYYTERNGYRMPAYHRLDLSVTYHFSPRANLNLSIYNAYNQQNAFAIMFQQDKTNPLKTEAVQVTLFPIIPSITYNLTF